MENIKAVTEKKKKVITLLLLGLCLVSMVMGIVIIAKGPFYMVGISGEDKIAIISIEGAIVGGRSGFGIFGLESGADEIGEQIKRAVKIRL